MREVIFIWSNRLFKLNNIQKAIEFLSKSVFIVQYLKKITWFFFVQLKKKKKL